jgi:hypothetical protein
MKINYHEKYFDLLDIYEHDDAVVKVMAERINLTKGWDNLPHYKHTAVAFAYRDDDIWIFERKRIIADPDKEDGGVEMVSEVETEDIYRAIRFPDLTINEGMDEYALAFLNNLKLEPRYTSYNSRIKKDVVPFIYFN